MMIHGPTGTGSKDVQVQHCGRHFAASFALEPVPVPAVQRFSGSGDWKHWPVRCFATRCGDTDTRLLEIERFPLVPPCSQDAQFQDPLD